MRIDIPVTPPDSQKRPTHEALLMCKAIKAGTAGDYLMQLEKMPHKKIVRIFLMIIYSKSAGLPILFDEELPAKIINGTTFDPVQNIQARMMTKIHLLCLVESESKKLGIWNEIHTQWADEYSREIREYVQIIEAIIRQCESTSHHNKIPELRHCIELIKASNRQHAINW
jgi:hypothetical protein